MERERGDGRRKMVKREGSDEERKGVREGKGGREGSMQGIGARE